MKNRIPRLIATGIACLCESMMATSALADETYYTATTNGYTFSYRLDGANAVIERKGLDSGGATACFPAVSPAPSGAFAVPATLDGHPVTGLGSHSFETNTLLTAVTLPESLTEIGESVFFQCTALQSVNIPDGVTGIGPYAFGGCSALTGTVTGAGVKSAGFAAFANSSGIKEIRLPAVTNLGDRAFLYCTSLTNVVLGADLAAIGNQACGFCSSLAAFEISADVTTIGDAPFQDCSALKRITLAAGNTAFCVSNAVLYTADFSSIVLTIPQDTLPDPLVIPDTVTNIQDGAFSSRLDARSVTIPDSVTVIPDKAFQNSSSLTNLVLGARTTTIRRYAFDNCGLLSVTIPASVTTLGDGAFCDIHLTRVTFLGNAPASVGSDLYSSSSATTNYVGIGSTGWSGTPGDATLPATWQEKPVVAMPSLTMVNSVALPEGADSQQLANYKSTFLALAGSKFTLSVVKIEDGFAGWSVSPEGIDLGPNFQAGNNRCTITLPETNVVITGHVFSKAVSVTASQTLKDEIRVAWEAVPEAVSYSVYRRNNWGYSTLDTNKATCVASNLTDLVYHDASVVVNQRYSYWVRAASAYGVPLSNASAANGMRLADPFDPAACVQQDGIYYNATNLAELVSCPKDFAGGDLVLSNGITTIDLGAFEGCTNLTSIVIPASVTLIGSGAFAGCTSLTNVLFLHITSAPTVPKGDSLYLDTPANLVTYVGQFYSGSWTLSAPGVWQGRAFVTVPTPTVVFEGNGGTYTNEASRTLMFGQPFGELPVPTWEKGAFAGWYTTQDSIAGEVPVTAETTVTQTDDYFQLYAHWTMWRSLLVNNGTATIGGVTTNAFVNCLTNGVTAVITPATPDNFAGWDVTPAGADVGPAFSMSSATTTIRMPDDTVSATAIQWVNYPFSTLLAAPGKFRWQIPVYLQNAYDGSTYEIYRAEGDVSNATFAAATCIVSGLTRESLPSTGYLDAGVLEGATYTYWTVATSPWGVKLVSTPASSSCLGNLGAEYCAYVDGLLCTTDGTDRVVFCLLGVNGVVALPANARSLDANAFESCADVTAIVFPAGFTGGIGSDAFFDCTSLEKLCFLGDAPRSVDPDIFNEAPSNLTVYVGIGSTGWSGTPGDATIPATWHGRRLIAVPAPVVTLDAAGGTVSPATVKVLTGLSFGKLPVPVREKFEFNGWYTNSDIPVGESPVTADTLVTQTNDFTLHAYWLELFSLTVNGGTTATKLSPGGMAIDIAATCTENFAGWQVEPADAFIWSGFTGFDATKTVQTITMPAMDLTLTAHYFAGPIVVTAADGASTKKISVSWNSVADGATYTLYRADGTNAAFAAASVLATNLASTAYGDTSAVTNLFYTYWVTATSAQGVTLAGEPDTGFLATGDSILNETDPLAGGSLAPARGMDFTGLLYGNTDVASQTVTSVKGLVTLNVSGTPASGRMTAKVQLANKWISFSSKGWGAPDSNGTFEVTLAARSGETLALAVRDDRLQGTLAGGSVEGTLEVDGARNRFVDSRDATGAKERLSGFLGSYTVALPLADASRDGAVDVVPDGTGYLSVTIQKRGCVRFAGMLANGVSVSGSTTLLDFKTEAGEMAVPVFAPLRSQKGWLGALVWISTNGDAFVESDYGWQGVWRQAGKGTDGFTAALGVTGGRYDRQAAFPSELTCRVSGVPAYVYRGLSIEAVGLALPTGLKVGFSNGRFVRPASTRPVRVGGTYSYQGPTDSGLRLNVSSSTGVMSGSFRLYYDAQGIHKTSSVSVRGVRLSGSFAGFGLVRETDPELKHYAPWHSIGFGLE